MAQEKTPEEQIKEAAWTYASWTLVLLITFLAGLFLGYQLWGEKAALEKQLADCNEQIIALKNERENLNNQIALSKRERETLQERVKSLQAELTRSPSLAGTEAR